MDEELSNFIDQLRGVDPALAGWAGGLAQGGTTLDELRSRLSAAMAVVQLSRPDTDPEREQLYKDTLTNWVETQCGLWARVMERPVRDDDLNVLSVKVQDAEDEDEPTYTVTLETVRTGFARIVNNAVTSLHSSYIATVAGAYATNDGGMIDADLCDIVVQAGLFNGEIIYG